MNRRDRIRAAILRALAPTGTTVTALLATLRDDPADRGHFVMVIDEDGNELGTL